MFSLKSKTILFLSLLFLIGACTHSAERAPQSKTEKECLHYPMSRFFNIGDTFHLARDLDLKSWEHDSERIIAATKATTFSTEMKHPSKRYVPQATHLRVIGIHGTTGELTLASKNGTKYKLGCRAASGAWIPCNGHSLNLIPLKPDPVCTEYKVQPATFENQAPAKTHDTDVEL